MDNLTRTTIQLMARRANIVLTDGHWRVLEYAHTYYARNQVGPLYRNIERYTGVTQDTVERMFPHGLQSVYHWVDIPIQITHEIPCKPIANIKASDYREVFLDHNATTYLRKEVSDAMRKFLDKPLNFANPSSSSTPAKKIHHILEKARFQVAHCLGVHHTEIIFTGSGSEAINLAIKGIAFRHLSHPGHLITSVTEHSAVLQTIRFLEGLGFNATYLEVDREGIVSAQSVREAIRPDTQLVSIMAANNEIGVINPIAEIGAICRAIGVPLMVDAVQAFGKIPLHPRDWGVSLLALSGHKIYAPKGVGALYVAANLPVIPLIHGGEQEDGRRAGTENVMGILGLGLAAKLAHRELTREAKRLACLRNQMLTRLQEIEPKMIVNGSLFHRLPNNLNVGFPGIDSGSLLLSLNQIGISVSVGSACHSGGTETSHVIRALGVDTDHHGIVRFSLGLHTTEADLDYFFRYLPSILSDLRASHDQGQNRH
ncbi:cysteine desulfurase [Gammaproteobacteria bacterium]